MGGIYKAEAAAVPLGQGNICNYHGTESQLVFVYQLVVKSSKEDPAKNKVRQTHLAQVQLHKLQFK